MKAGGLKLPEDGAVQLCLEHSRQLKTRLQAWRFPWVAAALHFSGHSSLGAESLPLSITHLSPYSHQGFFHLYT